MTTTKTIVVVPDIQAPKHDKAALAAVVKFIGDVQPDEVIQIGDALDFEGPARWTKDTREEYAFDVEQEAEDFRREFIEPVRAVYDGKFGMIEGNHDLRPRAYLEKYAPALQSKSRHYHFDVLCDFASWNVDLLPAFHEFHPGHVATHGHLGRIGLRPVAGMTALGAAMRWGKSVIMGHTHRMAAIPYTTGVGEAKTIWGVEVGNLMDPNQADYLKGTPGNWQRGFAVIHCAKSGAIQPECIYFRPDNSFDYQGQSWCPPGTPVRDANGRFKKRGQ